MTTKYIHKNIYLIFYCLGVFPVICQTNPTKVLSEYVKFKSTSRNEKPAALYMKQVCESLGLFTTVFSDTDSSYNFSASLLPLDIRLPSVLLINHTDVVSADENSNWKFEPFSGKISHDTVYGRGTIDMKGLAVMQVFALKRIKDSLKSNLLDHNVIILFLAGEENGGKNGAAKMIDSTTLDRLNPEVVFGEGGGGLTNIIPGKENDLCFFVSNAEKKSLWIKLEATIKSRGHGSVPSSKTANRLLLKAIQKIEKTESRIFIDESTEITFKKLGTIIGGGKGFVVKHINWWIFKPLRKNILNNNEALKTLVTNSYQLTQIQNPQGGSVNQVAQTASAYYDCRLLPNKSEQPLFMKLLFRIVDPRIKITVLDESPEADPSELNKHYENMDAAIKSVFPNAHVIPVTFPATTDNSYFRKAGVSSFGVLPFQLSEDMMESVHASNERIPVKAINDGIKVYVNFLRNYVK